MQSVPRGGRLGRAGAHGIHWQAHATGDRLPTAAGSKARSSGSSPRGFLVFGGSPVSRVLRSRYVAAERSGQRTTQAEEPKMDESRDPGPEAPEAPADANAIHGEVRGDRVH